MLLVGPEYPGWRAPATMRGPGEAEPGLFHAFSTSREAFRREDQPFGAWCLEHRRDLFKRAKPASPQPIGADSNTSGRRSVQPRNRRTPTLSAASGSERSFASLVGMA